VDAVVGPVFPGQQVGGVDAEGVGEGVEDRVGGTPLVAFASWAWVRAARRRW
jgi:hypothetical protein